jgi:hypothetical protein
VIIAGVVLVIAMSMVWNGPVGMRDGPKRLLSGSVPLDGRGPELATVMLAAGLVALIAALLARRGWAGSAVVVIVGYTVALAVSASAGEPSRTVALPALVSLGLLVAARPGRGEHRAHDAAVFSTAAVLVIVAVVVGPSGNTVDGRPRADARRLIDQPLVIARSANPLQRFIALLTGPDTALFAMRTTARDFTVRLATLDQFEQAGWTANAAYQRAGASLPDTGASTGPTVDFAVSIDQALEFVPRIGTPLQVSAEGLGFQSATGDLLIPDGWANPDLSITGRLPGYDAASLATAVAGGRGDDLDGLTLPPSVITTVDTIGGGATTSFTRLARLSDFFASSGGFRYDDSAEAPVGNGLFQIDKLLTEKRGTAEQFASAFAVMAEAMGYDARVVVGFRPTRLDVASGTYTIHAHDIHAWPEVRLRTVGWVPFEPSPLGTRDLPAGAIDVQPDPVVATAISAAIAPPPPATPPTATPPPTPVVEESSWWRYVVIGMAGLLAIMAAAIVRRVLTRRRWRHSGSPASRVEGAWRVLRRALGRHVRTTSSRSTVEVVEAVDATVGGRTSAHDLARIVERVRYSGTMVEEADADAAWQHSDAIIAQLRTATRRAVRV